MRANMIQCPNCSGIGRVRDHVRNQARNCLVCEGTGNILDKESVKEFMTRSPMDLKHVLPTPEDITNLVYALNTKIRKEKNIDKKHRLTVIREEMMKLKQQLL